MLNLNAAMKNTDSLSSMGGLAAYAFDPSILREYDIRGEVGKTLSETDAYHIGRAYAAFHLARTGKKNATIAVGRDGRLTSPGMAKALAQGLNDGGLNAVKIGLGPTPMLYFAVFHLDLDGGIMVTGSHNPPAHNGFKMMLGKKALFGEDIRELGTIASAGNWSVPTQLGETTSTSLLPAYIDTLVDAYDGTRPLRAVWDAGNGAAGEVMAELCNRLPGQHQPLNAEIDGTFPNHHPDPSVAENLTQLIDVVIKSGAEIGLAFDGDGDRLGVVDGKGRILWGDQIMALLAEDVLQQQPGATVIADVKASQILFDHIEHHGGKPLMWKTGHSLVKAKMAEIGAPLAGEMSGHIFFADRYYGFDDGLYAAVRLLGTLSRMDMSLADWLDTLPEWQNTPEMRLECDETRKFAIIDEAKARLAAEGTDFSDVDGMRVTTEDGWWLLRASNTQAVLVARCESKDADGLARLQAHLKRHLEASGISLEM